MLHPVVTPLLLGAAAYLVGSIPFGMLIARARGVDIRRVGSGNIGATNVFRCVGKGWGVLTFAGDVAKGFVAAFVLVHLAAIASTVPPAHITPLQLLGACLAVVGHNWPVFAGFRGGKGVATTVGGLLGIVPVAMGTGLLVWIVVVLLFRYVSAASLAAAVAVAAYVWATRNAGELLLPITMTFLAALIVLRHKSNIVRLVQGTEHRFSFGKKETSKAGEDVMGDG